MPNAMPFTVQVQQVTAPDGTEQTVVQSNIDENTPNVWTVIGQLLVQGIRAAALEEAKQMLSKPSPLVQSYSTLRGLDIPH